MVSIVLLTGLENLLARDCPSGALDKCLRSNKLASKSEISLP